MLDITSLRKNYALTALHEADVLSSPIAQFKVWFEQANQVDVPEPNAFTLATTTKDGTPNARIVLLKELIEEGFIFYTNYNSQKAKELIDCPKASMCFLWHALERQVRVRGLVSKVSKSQSETYFHSRPRSSQLGAWASPQSDEIIDDAYLSQRFNYYDTLYPEGSNIPLPDHWGGFLIAPIEIEFWQGRPSRLHDRILYKRSTIQDATWSISRLAP